MFIEQLVIVDIFLRKEKLLLSIHEHVSSLFFYSALFFAIKLSHFGDAVNIVVTPW